MAERGVSFLFIAKAAEGQRCFAVQVKVEDQEHVLCMPVTVEDLRMASIMASEGVEPVFDPFTMALGGEVFAGASSSPQQWLPGIRRARDEKPLTS